MTTNVREAILARLGELGWSQSDLSRATGIPKQNMGPMLRGDRPLRVQHMLLIEHALGLSLDYGHMVDPGGGRHG